MTKPREIMEEATGLRSLHPPEEGDPELLAGDPMPDPWDDPDQTDWPTELLDLDPAPSGEEGGR